VKHPKRGGKAKEKGGLTGGVSGEIWLRGSIIPETGSKNAGGLPPHLAWECRPSEEKVFS